MLFLEPLISMKTNILSEMVTSWNENDLQNREQFTRFSTVSSLMNQLLLTLNAAEKVKKAHWNLIGKYW